MRNIPQTLLNKLLERRQAPGLRIICTQAASNTLLSEPVHEGIPSDSGDVAIRQLPGEKSPSLAYAVCIDNGTAKVYERRLPASLERPRQYVWTLGAVKDVGIEFDGQWVLEAGKRWYILETEETPYLFWVESDGALYVQKWDDASTRLTLDTGVSQISVCKGWSSTLMTGLDQGLIAGYLKGGRAYYRAYCRQDTGESLWEPSYEVTELGDNNNTLSVFRTNDFRIGFLSESGGRMRRALSSRNYAGMSVRPESVSAQAQEPVIIIDKTVDNLTAAEERACAQPQYPYCLLMPPDAPEISVIASARLNVDEAAGFESYGFKLYLSHRLYGALGEDFIEGIAISPETEVTGASYDDAEQAITITVSPSLRRTLAVAISIKACRPLFYKRHQEQKHPLDALSCSIAGDVYTIDAICNEAACAALENVRFAADNARFQYNLASETACGGVAGVSVQLVPAANLPI